jgi:hypothetical protein
MRRTVAAGLLLVVAVAIALSGGEVRGDYYPTADRGARAHTVVNTAADNHSWRGPTTYNLNSEVRDTLNWRVPGSPTRITVSEAGWYYIVAQTRWDASGQVASRHVRILINGTDVIGANGTSAPVTGFSYIPRTQAVTIKYLSAGTYVEYQVFQNTSTSAVLNPLEEATGLAVVKIGR